MPYRLAGVLPLGMLGRGGGQALGKHQYVCAERRGGESGCNEKVGSYSYSYLLRVEPFLWALGFCCGVLPFPVVSFKYPMVAGRSLYFMHRGFRNIQ